MRNPPEDYRALPFWTRQSMREDGRTSGSETSRRSRAGHATLLLPPAFIPCEFAVPCRSHNMIPNGGMPGSRPWVMPIRVEAQNVAEGLTKLKCGRRFSGAESRLPEVGTCGGIWKAGRDMEMLLSMKLKSFRRPYQVPCNEKKKIDLRRKLFSKPQTHR